MYEDYNEKKCTKHYFQKLKEMSTNCFFPSNKHSQYDSLKCFDIFLQIISLILDILLGDFFNPCSSNYTAF